MDVEYWLNEICFRWDHAKAAENLRKHRTRFETACEVLFDPFVRWIDAKVVGGEERNKVIGMTTDWCVLVVVYGELDDAMRLISARPATRRERQTYESQ